MTRLASIAARALPLVLAAACAPISVSHYQTAKPLGKGNVQGGGGIHIQKSGAYGLDRENEDGDRVVDHHAFTFLPIDLELHYGIADRTEVLGKLFPAGWKVGARHTLVNRPEFKTALEVSVGRFRDGGDYSIGDPPTVEGSYTVAGTVVDLPFTISLHANDYLAIYGGPVLTLFSGVADFEERDPDTDEVTDSFTRRGSFWQAGGFIGLNLGRRIQLSPGLTFYLESTEYPVKQFGGDGVFAYPFLGLTVATDRSPKPAPAPPSSAGVDSPEAPTAAPPADL